MTTKIQAMPLHPPVDNTSHFPDVDRVLNSLDFEIESIRDDRKRPGWTMWALLGALGGLSWIALDLIGKGANNGSAIAIAAIGALISYDAIVWLNTLLSPDQDLSRKKGRFST